MWMAHRFIPLCEGFCDQPRHVLVLQALHAVSVHREDQLAYLQPASFISSPMLLESYFYE